LLDFALTFLIASIVAAYASFGTRTKLPPLKRDLIFRRS
jgi:hypothetical protein